MFQILEESRDFNSGVRLGFLKNGSPEPHLIITFDRSVCDILDWVNGWYLRLQIGTNGHQGLLRVSVSPEPTNTKFEIHMEGAKADFGSVPDLCKETRHPRTTQATVFVGTLNSSSSIQVKIPTWEDNLPKFSAVKKSVAPKPARGGPKVIFEPYPVLIYAGNELPLYEFQAILLEPLTHQLGGIFPANVIIEKGYKARGSAPHPAISLLLPTEMEMMRGKLKTVGLSLKHVKGTGYSLHVMEELHEASSK